MITETNLSPLCPNLKWCNCDQRELECCRQPNKLASSVYHFPTIELFCPAWWVQYRTADWCCCIFRGWKSVWIQNDQIKDEKWKQTYLFDKKFSFCWLLDSQTMFAELNFPVEREATSAEAMRRRQHPLFANQRPAANVIVQESHLQRHLPWKLHRVSILSAEYSVHAESWLARFAWLQLTNYWVDTGQRDKSQTNK